MPRGGWNTLAALPALGALFHALGCSSGCLDICTVGVSLLIIDRTTREPICDATVMLLTRSGTVLVPSDRMTDAGLPSCAYPVQCSGAGTYQFQISKPGFDLASTSVVVPG